MTDFSTQLVSFKNYIGKNDLQCRYIRGVCSYVCRIKQDKKHLSNGDLVGTTECLTL